MRTILAIGTDWHGNHKSGLMNPEVILYEKDEEGTPKPYHPEPTLAQKKLWEYHTKDVAGIFDLADNCDVIFLYLGDPTHGTFRATNIVSSSLANQILIALSNFEPMLMHGNLKAVRLGVGTEVHEIGEGSSTILMADVIRRSFTELDIKPVYHGLYNIYGKRIDYAHHGPPPGNRTWLQGNVALYYLKDIMLRELEDGREPPDVVLRGHYHEYVPVPWIVRKRGRDWFSQLVICPSYFMFDDWTYRIMRSKAEHSIGMVAFEIEDGKISLPIPFVREIDQRTKETYNG